MPDYLGSIPVLAFRGNPERLKEIAMVLMRPGVEGVAVWRSAKKGLPFQLRSESDAYNLGHATALYRNYCNQIAQDPQPIMWKGLDLSRDKIGVVVLDVKMVLCQRQILGVGGLFYPSLAWLECDWNMVAVPLTS
ncbi:MAG TPA: hypothetical protein VMW52_10015 [Phycisphaerae bacterium]|nr:hypothetical protein [Phycisphaerae bacterium]